MAKKIDDGDRSLESWTNLILRQGERNREKIQPKSSIESKLIAVSTKVKPTIKVVAPNQDGISALNDLLVEFSIKGNAEYTLQDLITGMFNRGYYCILEGFELRVGRTSDLSR